jgi:hypothetical protein
MLPSPSSEVSEIKMEGLSAVLSDEPDFWACNSSLRAWHNVLIGGLADAAGPRWWRIRSRACSGGQWDMIYLARRSCTFEPTRWSSSAEHILHRESVFGLRMLQATRQVKVLDPGRSECL